MPSAGETKIGLSYGKLCQGVKPGNIILIADGAISVEVVKIMSETELLGKVINSHKLGQRKNCNLPGRFSIMAYPRHSMMKLLK